MTTAIVPLPRCPVSVRGATPADQPFIDSLQKMHTHMVGWMPAKQLEEKIAAGQVIVAEANEDVKREDVTGAGALPPHVFTSSRLHSSPVGYCISHDQYAGRDDVGIIFQLNVLPLRQRHLIGATLIKAVFERAAYGCRLFCCWCAQDIQANYFWESVGFVPLAFRTGSREKQRIHIFWQRRVREGDTTTPLWFPSKTKAGAVREDRLVVPIPVGTHWRDAKPILLPGVIADAPPSLPARQGGRPRVSRPFVPMVPVVGAASKHLQQVPPGKAAVVTGSGIRYLHRADYVPPPPPPRPKREPKPRVKHDPKQVAAARELRDRYLEHVNADASALLSEAKYDVSRRIEGREAEREQRLLAG